MEIEATTTLSGVKISASLGGQVSERAGSRGECVKTRQASDKTRSKWQPFGDWIQFVRHERLWEGIKSLCHEQ